MAKAIKESLASGILSQPEELLLARHAKKKEKGGNEVTRLEAKSERFMVAKNAKLDQWKSLQVLYWRSLEPFHRFHQWRLLRGDGFAGVQLNAPR